MLNWPILQKSAHFHLSEIPNKRRNCQLKHFKVNWGSIIKILPNDTSGRMKLALIETLVQLADRELDLQRWTTV
jgi:hypothetical protein